MEELVNRFEAELKAVTLVPSDGGRFEVSVNGRLLYSKLQTHRHAEPGEVAGLIQSMFLEGK